MAAGLHSRPVPAVDPRTRLAVGGVDVVGEAVGVVGSRSLQVGHGLDVGVGVVAGAVDVVGVAADRGTPGGVEAPAVVEAQARDTDFEPGVAVALQDEEES